MHQVGIALLSNNEKKIHHRICDLTIGSGSTEYMRYL